MLNIKKILALNLKALRKARSLTQPKMAEFLGIDNGTIAKWETMTRFPSGAQLQNIIEKMDIPADYLFKNQGTRYVPSLHEALGIIKNELGIEIKPPKDHDKKNKVADLQKTLDGKQLEFIKKSITRLNLGKDSPPKKAGKKA